MNEYKANAIKNVVLLGHLGSGKTSLAESLAFISGRIEKKGSVEKKTTISDYTVEEQNKLSSLSTGLIPVEFDGIKVNIFDAPGADEMIGDIDHVMSVSNAAILVIDATSGVEVGTEKMWLEIKKNNLPALIFINKMDKENVKFDELLAEIRTKLGKEAVPFCLPLGKSENFNGFADIVELKARIFTGTEVIDGEIFDDKKERVETLRQELIETVAGADEELLEKYFEGEELTMEEIHSGLHKSVMTGEAVPVMVGSATKDVGVSTLLHMIENYFPAVSELPAVKGVNEQGETVERTYSEDEPFSAFVFKTMIDPFIGKISLMQIISGSVKKDQDIYVSDLQDTTRGTQPFSLVGKTQIPLDVAYAGDIVAMSKLDGAKTGSTLSEKKNVIIYPQVVTPNPTMYVAIHPENKKDEDKLSSSLSKIALEDNTLEVKRNKETSQLLIGGQGMIHLGYVIDKMKNMYKIALQTEEQRIVYRETIKATAEAEGRYIKQSGGSGYYGVVVMRFEPIKEGYEFDEEIFGGSVPRGYWPAVDKGLQDTLEHGVLAGFPVIGVRGVLTDGKYHSVDSNELAFKMAASIAFKEACKTAKPTILEPIFKVEVTIKDEYLGDVLGDMNKRRGRVLGMEPATAGYQKVIAEAPEAEISKYTIDLKAMTQGSGTFSRAFDRYEEVPGNLIDKIIEEQKKYVEENKK